MLSCIKLAVGLMVVHDRIVYDGAGSWKMGGLTEFVAYVYALGPGGRRMSFFSFVSFFILSLFCWHAFVTTIFL